MLGGNLESVGNAAEISASWWFELTNNRHSESPWSELLVP